MHKVTVICQDICCKVYGVIFKLSGLQELLTATGSQLSGAHNSLTVARELLEQLRRHAAASHLPLEVLFSSLVFCFVGGIACSVNDEVLAHQAIFSNAVTPLPDNLELNWQSVVE